MAKKPPLADLVPDRSSGKNSGTYQPPELPEKIRWASVNIPEEYRTLLRIEAAKTGRKLGNLLIDALDMYFSKLANK